MAGQWVTLRNRPPNPGQCGLFRGPAWGLGEPIGPSASYAARAAGRPLAGGPAVATMASHRDPPPTYCADLAIMARSTCALLLLMTLAAQGAELGGSKGGAAPCGHAAANPVCPAVRLGP